MRRAGLAGLAGLAAALTAVIVIAVAATASADTTAKAPAPKVRASYTQIINDVMCVVCHESLAVAQSPEAYQERDYVRRLIIQGETRQRIEHNLVEQYGTAVLAKPPAHGVNLLVYIIPPVVLILGLTTLAVFVPRWRRRARQDPPPATPAAALDPADAQRLNDDLGRFA
jgi:cytochrome c-type biogenesis protein CcmH/NrfF